MSEHPSDDGRAVAWQPPDEWRTSTSEPYEVDQVDLTRVPGLADAPGALGMGFAPGKYDRYGKQDRDLATDVARLRDVHRADALLLLVSDAELDAMRIPTLSDALADAGIDLIRHPIPDFGVPTDLAAFGAVVDDVLGRIRGGQRLVVACFGGFGRTGTVTATMLRSADMSAADAIDLVRATRPGTIERDTQIRFVEGWAD